jgi:DNA polymerase gamma 1
MGNCLYIERYMTEKGASRGKWVYDENGIQMDMPRPDGDSDKYTSSMFPKDYVKMYEDGIISTTSNNSVAVALIVKKVSTLNWISIRKRVAAINVGRCSTTNGLMDLTDIAPTGTTTGRCRDSLWLVCANPKAKRIGTELKSMVEAPAGYVIVGADIDSEEAWLAGILGDSLNGFNGSTALGFINVEGSKEAGNDLHTLMAVKAKTSRDTAKDINYAMMYGQGQTGASSTLRKATPSMSQLDATDQAKEFISSFKGYQTNYYGTKVFRDGLASEAFNKMNHLVSQRQPKTPLLGAWLTAALTMDSKSVTSRFNWVVQASGVDFRDLLVLLVKEFARKLQVDMTLLICIHDEVRYLVPDQDKYKAAQVLQLAHLYVRAAFIDCLDLDNIPSGVAWFSAVDIDTVLRKDPTASQITPSQPSAIPPGYCLSAAKLAAVL